jgi:hypothetical protein
MLSFMRKEKKEGIFSKRNLMAMFIVFIMIFSALVVFVSRSGNEEGGITYKNSQFTSKGGYWETTINEKTLQFEYTPYDVEEINLTNDTVNRLLNTLEIDATADFNGTYKKGTALAQYRLGQNLKIKDIYIRPGSINKTQYNIPIITCRDSTQKIPVIYFKESNETKVYLDGNCIIAEADSDINFVKIANKMIYSILGVV